MSQEQKDWRNAVAELRELTVNQVGELKSDSAEYKERFESINDRLDTIDMEVKKVATPTPSPDTIKSNVINEFKDVALEFVKGNRHALNQREVKNWHPGIESKSNNLVRFDLASAGALLLPNQISTDIIKDVTEATPVMGLARVTPTSRSNYERRVRTSKPGGRWLGEALENTKTKPTYAIVSIPPQKYAAEYGMSIEQEQDTGYNLVSELMQAFREDFSVDFGSAFINGDGISKPTGFVGKVENYETASNVITTDDLIFAQETLKESYQTNGTWLFNRDSRAVIRSLVLSATNGLQYTWEPDFTRKSPTLLLGSPIAIARVGDLASPSDKAAKQYDPGAVFAAYGDFRSGYEVVMHSDMYLIDDVYSDANSFVRNLHVMSRVGGNVIQKEALTTITAKA
jgi:HK97 family phage major capsid protein